MVVSQLAVIRCDFSAAATSSQIRKNTNTAAASSRFG